MSRITKKHLRIIVMRVRNKTKLKIAEEQNDFVEGKGTTKIFYYTQNCQPSFRCDANIQLKMPKAG